jgi:hypothetical protein
MLLSLAYIDGFVDPRVDDDNSLDIFQMTIRSTEPTKELVKRKHLVFLHY